LQEFAMRRGLSLFAVLVFAWIASAETAQAQWTRFQRDEFTNGCVPSCQRNPNLQRRLVSRCEAYCACVMREGESRYSSAQYEILERDARDNVQSPLLREFAAIYPVCSRRIFSD
jgi:hypothetical protein